MENDDSYTHGPTVLDRSQEAVLWPVHPKPQEDELTSSWLARIAWGNHVKLHTFCDLTWRRRAIWNRDIDKSATREFIDILALRTGTTPSRAWQTTLCGYEGWIYSRHNPAGNTRWILPLGIYHRTHRRFGLQFCPRCLAEDAKPYFRRRWRLAFVTACADHCVMLLDRCPECGNPVCFHRREIGDRRGLPDGLITHCFACDYDLRHAKAIGLEPAVAPFHRLLTSSLNQGWVFAPNGRPVYAHLYLDVLHQMMKLALSGRSRDFGKIVKDASGLQMREIETTDSIFEHLDVASRHRLLSLADWLFGDWPDRFVTLCRTHELWSSWLLRDLTEVPFWFAEVVQKDLYVRHAAADAEHEMKLRRFREAVRRSRPPFG